MHYHGQTPPAKYNSDPDSHLVLASKEQEAAAIAEQGTTVGVPTHSLGPQTLAHLSEDVQASSGQPMTPASASSALALSSPVQPTIPVCSRFALIKSQLTISFLVPAVANRCCKGHTG